jgi:serine/threonine-protein kinase HipA
VLIAFNQITNAVADGAGLIPDGFEAWLVKFRSSRNDLEDHGPLEATYADMARAAGLSVAPTRLFPGSRYGYFGTQRFDRLARDARLHVLSAAAMLDIDWDGGALDYDHLMRLARYVVGRHDGAERIFGRMVFNVVAYNRDDHAKQHAFVMTERGAWDLAPSFDLTFSRGRGNEHYLAVKGSAGDDITAELMVELGREHCINAAASRQTIERTIDVVDRFEEFARPYPMSSSTRRGVKQALQSNIVRLTRRASGE